jgi:hypothetical protein
MRSIAILADNNFHIVSYAKYGLMDFMVLLQESSATCTWKGWTNSLAGFTPLFSHHWPSRVQLPTR